MNQTSKKFVDLFCGVGGFHQALTNLGHECVFACDIDEDCRRTYKENYGIEPEGDITSLNIERIPDFDILCAGFPCFVKDTRVLTNVGYKKIQDVGLDDLLMTHTGLFQEIINTQKKVYTGMLFNIKAECRPYSVICTPEHPFYTREKRKLWSNVSRQYQCHFENPKWVTAKDFTSDTYIGMKVNEKETFPLFSINQQLVTLDDMDMWYMMGYFLGNGWINKSNKQIFFVVKNQCVLAKLERVLSLVKQGDKFTCSNDIWWNILGHFCGGGEKSSERVFKLVPEKVLERCPDIIPEWVQDAPVDCIQEFIEGYKVTNSLTTVSIDIAYGLQRLYLKCGSVCSISKCLPKSTYKLSIGEKRGVYIDNGYAWFRATTTAIDQSDEDVYNFQVETDNSYIVENTIVHNCQPFSKAGKQEGFGDERGNLFFSIRDIIKLKRPEYILMENVRNLVSHDNGNTWKVMYKELTQLKYKTYDPPVILNALQFGVAQNRERVVIMCVREDIGDLPDIEKLRKLPKQKTSLKSIMRQSESEYNKKYKIKGKMKVVEQVWDDFLKTLKDNNIKILKCPIWTDWWDGDGENTSIQKKDPEKSDQENERVIRAKQDVFYKKYKKWIDTNREFYKNHEGVLDEWLKRSRNKPEWIGAVRKLEWQAGDLKPDSSMYTVLWTPRSSGVRIKNIDYTPTLVAMNTTPIYGPESRYLTPKEICRLQSFRENWIAGKNVYKQMGNAVNVRMIEECVKMLEFHKK